MNEGLSRRNFLTQIGVLTGAAWPGMMALGMVKEAPVHPLQLEGHGNGKKVIILGAGLAGMASAWELSKLGYECIILEARDRAGGRVFTIRKGSLNEETVNGKAISGFDEGLYFNAGPSRIPHHHLLTLHYCKELGVPLQVYNNTNESAWFFSEGNGPLSNRKIRKREIHNDMRGYMAELLYKAIDTKQLDTTLNKEDGEKLLEYLRAEGGLDIDALYKASARRGYTQPPGAAEKTGTIANPHKLADIISSGLASPEFYNVAEYIYELQATMFQAIGGNDMIAKAFEKKLSGSIKFNTEVTAIKNIDNGVQVTYKSKGGDQQLAADFCICTIPLPVLSNIDHNFSSDVSRAIDRIVYIPTGKMGMQFKRRFWEEDEMIYGGITHTNNILYQLFYPSNDYLSKKGMLITYYNFNERANTIGELSYKEREKIAFEKGKLIHPQYEQEYDHKYFSVSWHKTNYSLGGWAVYSEEERANYYKKLLTPDKQVYFAGEHLTHLNGWMAGALESARTVTTSLHARVTGQRVSYPVVGA
ncbi:MAG TPA: flavin monoamine oxidase family protein [Niastella sp.]